MRSRARVSGAALAAALLLAACSTSVVGQASPDPAVNAGLSAPASNSSEPETGSESGGWWAPDSTLDVSEVKLGGTYEWDDGLAITISEATPFTPAATAHFLPAQAYASVSITITNNTGAAFDPGDFIVDGMSGGATVTPVYDQNAGYTDPPLRAVQDGDQVTFKVGFGLLDPEDIVLNVMPSWDYYDIYFTTTGKMANAGGYPGAQPVAGVIAKESATDEPKFGQSYEWDSGLLVTISEPYPFTPSRFAGAAPAAAYVGFTVTIVNNTDALYEQYYMTLNLKSGGVLAEMVSDIDNGFAGFNPFTGVFQGRSSTFEVGFGVQDAADLLLQVSPDVNYFDAVFTG